MSVRRTTRHMSDKHEKDLVALLGGSMMPGSGNQWNKAMDGRHSRHDEDFALAWDGKSTMGKSISITLDMWEKAQEQAGGERPALALRWYRNDRLTDYEDVFAIGLDDFAELLDLARDGARFRNGEVQ